MAQVQLKQLKIIVKKLPDPVSQAGAEQAEFAVGHMSNDVNVVQEVVNAKPAAVEVEERPSTISGLDSEPGPSAVSTRNRKMCKKRHIEQSDLSLHNCSDRDEPAAKTQATGRRRRGRPPTTGKYVGIQKAQRALKAKKGKTDSRQRIKKEMAETLRSFLKLPALNTSRTEGIIEDRPISLEDLKKCGHIVKAISRETSNFKGMCQKSLNGVETIIRKYVEQPDPQIKTLEEEVKKWRDRSIQLEAEKLVHESENAALWQRVEELETTTILRTTEEAMDRMEARVMAKVESALMLLPNALVLTPPLTHEIKTIVEDPEPVISSSPNGESNDKGKGKGKSTAAPTTSPKDDVQPNAGPSSIEVLAVAGPSSASPSAGIMYSLVQETESQMSASQSEPRPLPSAPLTIEEPGLVVGKKNKKSKPPSDAAPAADQPKNEPSMRQLRSSGFIFSSP